MTPTFTILLPVTRPPDFLPLAVESVRNQRRGDWELFIVCDGPPRSTVEWATEAALGDPRISVFDFPKGERNGEVHRHHALASARGKYVAHLADDNLWFPDHLDCVERVLEQSDLGGTLFVAVAPTGRLHVADFLALTQSAYRLESYRALPVGWSPAPRTGPSDQFMFGKFRAEPSMREARLQRMTAVHLGTDLRAGFSVEERRNEMQRWAGRLEHPVWRELLRTMARVLVLRMRLRPRWYRLKSRVYRFLKRCGLPTRLPWGQRP